jgi:hypothetical protein
VRLEDVWRLPQSLRNGWHPRAERTSESFRNGRSLISLACIADAFLPVFPIHVVSSFDFLSTSSLSFIVAGQSSRK